MDITAVKIEGPEKIQVGTLREQVYDQIKRLILTNRLAPGQHIVIDQLANELGVSHTPVREALAMLELDGLVTMGHYKNPQVAEIDAADAREVFEVRLLLESWAASRAVSALSEEQLDAIGELFEHARQDAQRSGYETHIAADIAFHDMIARSTGNNYFWRLWQLVNDQSMRIRFLVEARSDEHIDTIIDEHCAILDALRARDPELSRKRMVSHLEAAMQRNLSALEDIVDEERA